MNLIRYNTSFPRFFDDFVTKELDQLFDNSGQRGRRLPATNVKETEDHFALELAVPGFEKDDFKVELDQDVLTVSVEKEENTKDGNDNFVKREFRYHNFSRSFRLPENAVDGDKIAAKYEAGILTLTLPKREEVKPKPARTIEIG
ncbi:MAG: Hsp20/alpha crystallin family protein [Tunicatimonas sp.]|uniref:Hsp20/alpha crystallin family protein n=1 Tax=Tunicatimonas sp. TaxID=1940096 RepID=UPI003C751542